MRIYRLNVRNFRGIKSLDWNVDASFVCLVGPGDSTKTTILDAIYYALYPSWNPALTDADFHKADLTSPISISVTVCELPDELKDLYRYEGCHGGRDKSGKLKEEPESDDELTLRIELVVDETLEPSWFLRSDRASDDKTISLKDRQLLGAFRLGDFLDRDFAWSRGSTLSRLTSNDDEIARVLAKASRTARGVIDQRDFPELCRVADSATEAAKRFGAPYGKLVPGIDSQISGVISLQEEGTPVRLSGLGSRRLLAIGLQNGSTRKGSILLIDEVEYGLEPHRLRHLTREITPEEGCGQTFITTHSPITLSTLDAKSIHVVRNVAGTITINPVPSNFSKTILKESPEALLGRKLLVCEGQTERALCEELDRFWTKSGSSPFAHIGVVVVLPEASGGTKKSPEFALKLAEAGYKVLYFGDGDDALKPTPDKLTATGVEVVLWASGFCTEKTVFRDLPWEGVVDLVGSYLELLRSYGEMGGQGDRALLSALKHVGQHIVAVDNGATGKGMMHSLEAAEGNYREIINRWKTEYEEDVVRQILGKASLCKDGWFKSPENSRRFSAVVTKHLAGCDPTTDLRLKIETLRNWTDG